jgi:hypothetical protein
MWVLDVDGADGLATLGRLEADHSPLPTTLTATTGSGGRHYVFAWPDRRVPNSCRKLGPGLDVRGDGGYIVIAPANHWTGGVYAWDNDLPLADAPAWLLDIVCGTPTPAPKAAPTQSHAAPTGDGRAIRYAAAALDGEVAAVRLAREGTRNATLNTASLKLGSLVAAGLLAEGSVRSALTSAALDAGLSLPEIEATLNSGLRAGMAHPRDIPDRPSQPRQNQVASSRPEHDPETGEIPDGPLGGDPPPAAEDQSTRKQPSKSAKPIPTDRPEIRIVAGQLHDVVDAAENALIARGGVYQRGTFLVRPGWSRITIHGGTKDKPKTTEAMRIIPVKVPNIAEMMNRSATFTKYNARDKEWYPTDCPHRVAETYVARTGQWKVATLTGIIQAPTLRPDGTILDQPGYDPETGLLFDPAGVTFPDIPDAPSRQDALGALEKLKALIRHFPFVSNADESVALSGFLTVMIRRSLPSAPLHAYTAPAPGTGKSFLVDGPAVLATGKPASVIAQGEKVEEFEKGLGSCLIAGDQIISIDNCEAPLGGVLLCQCLTQEFVKPRILGQSLNPDVVSNAAIYATGNNLTLIGDMTRRSLLCSLDAKCECPELRVFDFDFLAEAMNKRAELVVACLTILRAYVVAGKPKQPISPFGSFEGWSRWVRASLIWLGEADPLATAENIRAADPVLDQLRQVISAWHGAFGCQRVSVKDVIERVAAQPDAALREALLTVAGSGGAVNSRMLGKWLARHKDRIVDGLGIRSASMLHGNAQWEMFSNRSR